jgi:hypothetical protein
VAAASLNTKISRSVILVAVLRILSEEEGFSPGKPLQVAEMCRAIVRG